MSFRIEAIDADARFALAATLADLHALCFPDDPWAPHALAEVMGIPGFFGHIVLVGEAVSGLALAQQLGGEGEILALGVAPRHRRAGLGSALLSAALEEARRCRARRLFLEVAADNIAARALYRLHGFVQVGLRRNYYRRGTAAVDALVLRRLLST